MKKLVHCAIACAVVVAVLGTALLVLLRQVPPAAQGGAVVFTSAEPMDIASVTVKNGTGEYRFYKEGEGYVLDDIPADLADIDTFIAFMVNCGNLSAARRVDNDDTAASPADYGLDAPAATADIRLLNGNATTLSVGGQEQLSGDYYVSVSGFDGVYLMPAAKALPFLGPKTQVISRFVTPQLAVSSPLSAVRDAMFTGGELAAPVSIQATTGGDEAVKLAAMSFGTATHIVRGAGVYQLDQTYGVEILGSLFGLESTGIAGYGLSDAEIAAFGFDDPYMTVEYDMQNGADADVQHCVLKLAKTDGADFYAYLEGRPIVYTVARPAFADIVYDKLFLRWFLSPLLMDLSGVTVADGKTEVVFDIDNTDTKNPVVTQNGAPVDVETFRALFRLLTSAAHDGTYRGAMDMPDGTPALTVTYTYTDPAKAPDVLQLFPGDARRLDVFVNGAGEFAMKDTYAPRVLEGVNSLLAGEPVDENW